VTSIREIIQMNEMQKLWTSVMPPSIPTPDSHTFFLWVTTHEINSVQAAIVQTARKMSKNIYTGVPLIENGAAKYCSSILGNRKAVCRPAGNGTGATMRQPPVGVQSNSEEK
jgi:hypothetical protein